MCEANHTTRRFWRPAGGSLLLPPHVEPDRTVSRQRRAAQPGALDGGLEANRPQKANTRTSTEWIQSVADRTEIGHRTSSSIESAEIIGLDAPNAPTEGVKRQEKF